MSRFCTNCGIENVDTASFCSNCGTSLKLQTPPPAEVATTTPESEETSPDRTTPMPATGAATTPLSATSAPSGPTPAVEPTIAPGPAPTAGTSSPTSASEPADPSGEVVSAPAPPGLGSHTPSPSPVTAPPPAGFSSAASTGGTGAAPGGFSSAAPGVGTSSVPMPGGKTMSGKLGAIAAVMMVLLAGFAAVQLFSGSDEPVRSSENGNEGPLADDPGGDQEEADPVTEGGGLQDLIPETVGDATLTDIAQSPTLISNWQANDGYAATYAAADGTVITHHVASFSSPEDADATGVEVAGDIESRGSELIGSSPLEIDGETAGTKLVFQSVDGSIILWNNGVVLATVQGVDPTVVDEFFVGLPY